MAEEQQRDFGRDGVSGLVNRDRALRAKLLPRRLREEREAPGDREAGQEGRRVGDQRSR
ncbi:MAG TPA: hypothetical protein PJ992_04710 [Arachnia sp.]|jgi:hypothetical protein|nr:hypothetical protein [Arachnia sp.]